VSPRCFEGLLKEIHLANDSTTNNDPYSVTLSGYELRALAEWHVCSERQNDMPAYMTYVDHIKRAAQLLSSPRS
jgi:hypothetical protein